MDYLELNLVIEPKEPWAEILMVELAEQGYESFIETENGLIAYAQVQDVDLEDPVKNTIISADHPEFQVNWTVTIIPQQNWNTVWEADRKSVV